MWLFTRRYLNFGFFGDGRIQEDGSGVRDPDPIHRGFEFPVGVEVELKVAEVLGIAKGLNHWDDLT